MSKPRFKSDAYDAIHSSASALLRVGAIDMATMRDFDEACLSPLPEFAPRDIRRLPEANKVSQPVFARYLNTSESTVEKWETGAKRQSGMALKLLAICMGWGCWGEDGARIGILSPDFPSRAAREARSTAASRHFRNPRGDFRGQIQTPAAHL